MAAGKTISNKPSLASGQMKPCPICGKPPVEASKPFCSERCREVDLGRWLSGSYVIPARDTDEDEDLA
jgi:uncharacterized protein